MEDTKKCLLDQKVKIKKAWMSSIGLSVILSMSQDERIGDRTLNAHDVEKITEIIDEWEDCLAPILDKLDDPTSIIIDMFFDDYASAKEKILDASAKRKTMYLEEMAAFGDVIKKIDKKL